jgi:hypothetical protein
MRSLCRNSRHRVPDRKLYQGTHKIALQTLATCKSGSSLSS